MQIVYTIQFCGSFNEMIRRNYAFLDRQPTMQLNLLDEHHE